MTNRGWYAKLLDYSNVGAAQHPLHLTRAFGALLYRGFLYLFGVIV